MSSLGSGCAESFNCAESSDRAEDSKCVGSLSRGCAESSDDVAA